MKRFLVVLMACFVFVFASVPCFAYTDSGIVSGAYDLSGVSFDYPGTEYRYVQSGSVLANGVKHDFVAFGASHGVPVSDSMSYWVELADGSKLGLATGRRWNFTSLIIDFDGSFTLPSNSPWGKILSSAVWLDAPEPFPDSIGSAIESLVSWLGDGLTALVTGPFSPLLPLIGIGVAVSVVIFVWLLIKRSTWGS